MKYARNVTATRGSLPACGGLVRLRRRGRLPARTKVRAERQKNMYVGPKTLSEPVRVWMVRLLCLFVPLLVLGTMGAFHWLTRERTCIPIHLTTASPDTFLPKTDMPIEEARCYSRLYSGKSLRDLFPEKADLFMDNYDSQYVIMYGGIATKCTFRRRGPRWLGYKQTFKRRWGTHLYITIETSHDPFAHIYQVPKTWKFRFWCFMWPGA